MTLKEAQEIIKTPIFGDEKCIEAKRVIYNHDARTKLIAALQEDVDCDCETCGGTGQVKCEDCDGTGEFDFDTASNSELVVMAQDHDIAVPDGLILD